MTGRENFALYIAIDLPLNDIIEQFVQAGLIDTHIEATEMPVGPPEYATRLIGGTVPLQIDRTKAGHIGVREFASEFGLRMGNAEWICLFLSTDDSDEIVVDELHIARFIGWILRTYDGDAALLTDRYAPLLYRKAGELVLTDCEWLDSQLSAIGLPYRIEPLTFPS